MTRFARAGKRKFLEASTWEDLSAVVTEKDADLSGKKRKPPGKMMMKKKIKNKIQMGLSKQKEKGMQKDDNTNPKKQKQIEARRLRRKKGKCCFVCRQPDHLASDCPSKEDMKIGTCFKCGSSDHTTRKCKVDTGAFPFAKCFICQEMGHLAKSCPENSRGLYPQGGGCKICGSVEHLKRDCLQLQKERTSKGSTTEGTNFTTFETSALTSADAQENQHPDDLTQKTKTGKIKPKIVHF